MRHTSTVGLVVLLALQSFGALFAQPSGADAFPQGVASGEITPHSAILWTRAQEPVSLVLEVSTQDDYSNPLRVPVEATAARDQTVQVHVGDLTPGTRYFYRFINGSNTVSGSFATAPEPTTEALVRFAVGGDVGGQGYCRSVDRGYPAFEAMADLHPDFFIANGDMIYADNDCPANGPEKRAQIPGDFPPIVAADWAAPGVAREAILGHWRYNRADVHQQELLARTPIFAQWDDHEVINDFGAAWPAWPLDPSRKGWSELIRVGKEALFLFNPMPRHPDEPGRIYRSFRWGSELEVFLLDGRSYRSANDLPDTPANRKTLLGKKQLDWLKSGLAASTATWKIVSSDVPLSVPTGWDADLWGRDAFANGEGQFFRKRTGFERELRDLLGFLDQSDLKNVVFVVTDVHFAANLRYDVDVDGDGDSLLFHELISGPINAYKAPVPSKLDPTFRPITLYAEGGIFNFSWIRLIRSSDGTVHMVAEIKDDTGRTRFGSRLELAPQ